MLSSQAGRGIPDYWPTTVKWKNVCDVRSLTRLQNRNQSDSYALPLGPPGRSTLAWLPRCRKATPANLFQRWCAECFAGLVVSDTCPCCAAANVQTGALSEGSSVFTWPPPSPPPSPPPHHTSTCAAFCCAVFFVSLGELICCASWVLSGRALYS